MRVVLCYPVLCSQRATICRYKFQSSVGAYEDKTAVLSDTDTVWTDVRHMHMREAIDKLMADFNKFMTDNAGFKGCVRFGAQFTPKTRLLTSITEKVLLRSMI